MSTSYRIRFSNCLCGDVWDGSEFVPVPRAFADAFGLQLLVLFVVVVVRFALRLRHNTVEEMVSEALLVSRSIALRKVLVLDAGSITVEPAPRAAPSGVDTSVYLQESKPQQEALEAVAAARPVSSGGFTDIGAPTVSAAVSGPPPRGGNTARVAPADVASPKPSGQATAGSSPRRSPPSARGLASPERAARAGQQYPPWQARDRAHGLEPGGSPPARSPFGVHSRQRRRNQTSPVQRSPSPPRPMTSVASNATVSFF